ncbi:hypothetical protein L2E82_02471 [Cichorium intybus]|uniref:Uncharacterized protein n=1 Tax=Cichorium intybus TaxID=13427 RepID=A0ACB9H1C7_CICIN|nr:hypothetical protein L2E82_02471 [Cichorium intybus]
MEAVSDIMPSLQLTLKGSSFGSSTDSSNCDHLRHTETDYEGRPVDGEIIPWWLMFATFLGLVPDFLLRMIKEIYQ